MATTQINRRHAAVVRLATAQKSNRGAAGYSRWINRPLGRQFAAWCYVADLNPNQVSVLSALFTFPAIAAIALFHPSWTVDVAIVIALVIGYALDSADGQVARLRGGGSPAGEWLDHVFDSLKISSIHLAVAIAWFRFFPLSNSTVLIPLAFAVVSSVFFFALLLTDMLRRVHRVSAGGTSAATASVAPNEAAPVLRSLIVLPNDYGVLCLAFLLIPLPRTFAVVYAVLLGFNVVFLIVGCIRWFQELNTWTT